MTTPTTAAYLESIISKLIEECNNEVDIDKKIQLLPLVLSSNDSYNNSHILYM